MSSIQFLSRQGLAIRGDGDESDNNLHQLLSMKAEEDSNLNDRLKRKENVYTSPEIQNEIIKVMALQVFSMTGGMVGKPLPSTDNLITL